MNDVNIFTNYRQEENHFTNGLISLLSLSRLQSPNLLFSFLDTNIGVVPERELDTFRVLRGIRGTADAELRGTNSCIHIETKIVSGSLDAVQVRRHLKQLRRCPEKFKRLMLLTPDDSKSRYIEDFCSIEPKLVVHVGWKRVYDFLKDSVDAHPASVFGELTRQFLDRIHKTVFAQDQAGIILKIDFGDRSEVYAEDYLAEMVAGEWTDWNTPREYKSLNGTGRKLLLYDRTRQAITIEVEIRNVKRTNRFRRYPWTNFFAPDTLHVFEPPITLARIRRLEGFENFGMHRKDRNAFRNITREQYRELTS